MAEPAGSPSAAESSCPSAAALDPEFPPQSRPRSCTWPLPRPDLVAVAEPESGDGGAAATASPGEPGGGDVSGTPAAAAGPGGGGARKGGGGGGGSSGSGGARRNAWGSQSYADLISQAIQSAPDKRLTLAQIYEWMVRSVPYFRDKGDSNSSAGWKVDFGFCQPPKRSQGLRFQSSSVLEPKSSLDAELSILRFWQMRPLTQKQDLASILRKLQAVPNLLVSSH